MTDHKDRLLSSGGSEVQWVEIEVEVVRREKVVFKYDTPGKMKDVNAPSYDVGSFARALTYWTCHPRDLAKREESRLVSFAFLDGRCDGTLGGRPSWMSPDQYDPCRCDLPRGHEGPHECEHSRADAASL